jgi:hypothetical protein
MLRKGIIVIAIFVLVSAAVFGTAALAAPAQVTLPQVITADTRCPVAGCTQKEGCHAAGPAPAIDGSFEMTCPKVTGCTDVNCHAYDRLTSHYNKPSDASLNLWIVAPVLFVVGLVLIVKKLA